MRILMLGWELPPYNSGGLGVACYQLCKALSEKGADIEFVLPYTADHSSIGFMRVNSVLPVDGDSFAGAAWAYQAGRHYIANSHHVPKSIGSNIVSYEAAVSRIAKLGQFDIIHAHDWLTCSAAIKAKMISQKPLIVHFHSIESDRSGQEFGGNPLVREIESLALEIADRVIAVSQFTKNSIVREYGIAPDKIDVVYNHADLLDANTNDANVYKYLQEMKQHGYRVVINVGRLTIQKGITGLLRAFQHVVANRPKTLLLLVGDGDQKRELIELAAELGIAQNVFFAGFQRGKRLRDAFVVGDLFVLPSVSEPFGLVALEAIGCGTPVLVTKQSGVSEVIKSCLKVDFWDTNAMADKIVGVVQNDVLRDQLYSDAHKEYSSRSWRDSANSLWEVYSRHLAEVHA